MKAHYTPGPWTIDPELGVVWHETEEVCALGSVNAEANAQLIAAAPDLLSAAKIGLACCIAWGGKCEANGEHILARESVIQADVIRAAIEKATKS